MYGFKNRVMLVGNLGAAPDVKTTETGKKMARFSVATNENYKNSNGEKVTDTQWHNLVAWEKMAEVAEKILDKGTEVVVEGRLVSRSYTDKEGIKKYITEVVVSDMMLMNSRAAVS